jgi:hypothetical protein
LDWAGDKGGEADGKTWPCRAGAEIDSENLERRWQQAVIIIKEPAYVELCGTVWSFVESYRATKSCR